ncbi:hypothetical protein E4H12_15805 [Candidatus Thorarchaeota archaeon]|nr:MAG: hypothetical protein E4H12_15805 [Candidatus Thorarchaeota archaeon]
MSRHHISLTQARVLTDVQTLPTEEITNLYGIEVSDDGTVYDPTENLKFPDLDEWATHIAEQDDEDNYSSFSKIGGKHAFDDESF